MADKKLNDLAQLPSLGSLKNIYVEDANGVQYKLTKESLAEVLGGLIGIATTEKNGLMHFGLSVKYVDGQLLSNGKVLMIANTLSNSFIAFDLYLFHPWRGCFVYKVLISSDSSNNKYKVIGLSTWPYIHFYVQSTGAGSVKMYVGSTNKEGIIVAVIPSIVNTFVPYYTSLPSDAVELIPS